MNLIKGLFGAAAIAMGSAAYFVFLALVVFSLPLNVIALMRWFDLEWWTALTSAVVLGIVPIAGQLAYIVFTLAGAYFFVDAGFNWKQATHPAAKEFNVSQLTDEQFETFKK